MTIKDELSTHLRQFQSAPFLFVGSGISRRYLGLENWEDLLRKFSKETGKEFEYYYTKSNGNLPLAATYLAEDFHEQWWNSEKYNQKRINFTDHLKRTDSPLKIELADYMAQRSSNLVENIDIREELELLRKVNVDGIITTNWDNLLEKLFPTFEVYIGQEGLLFSQSQSIAEIYKIHGCCSVPNSIILTNEDYKLFEKRNPYLAAKLLTIFIEHPIIFMGYSNSDENIRLILDAITSCLTNENLDKLKDRLIFVQWDRDGKGDKFVSKLIETSEGKNLPVTVIQVKSFRPIYEALSNIKRKFPAKQLRQMKEQLYELVKTNDPRSRIYVQDINDTTETSHIEFVIGVGAIANMSKVGYRGIHRELLFFDLISDDENRYDPESIVETTLPELLKSATYVPIFKYLRKAGYLDDESKYDKLPPRIKKTLKEDFTTRFQPSDSYSKKKEKIHGLSIQQISAQYDKPHSIMLIPLLNKDDLSIPELHRLLMDNAYLIKSDNLTHKTNFLKLACFYDWLRFGQNL